MKTQQSILKQVRVMRFLIVDDSEDSLRTLERIIDESGHQVVAKAQNGQEAVERFKELRPEVVILDVIMPKMNGLDALKVIRSVDRETQIIMSCSLNSCQTAFESEQHGASYFLGKPFEKNRLENIIRKIAKLINTPRNAKPPLAPAHSGG